MAVSESNRLVNEQREVGKHQKNAIEGRKSLKIRTLKGGQWSRLMGLID